MRTFFYRHRITRKCVFYPSRFRYQPASASELLGAFRALDPERTGTVSRESMESALRHDGEPFEDEELEEMMSVAAVESATGTTVIPYEMYINKILVSLSGKLSARSSVVTIGLRVQESTNNNTIEYPPFDSNRIIFVLIYNTRSTNRV